MFFLIIAFFLFFGMTVISLVAYPSAPGRYSFPCFGQGVMRDSLNHPFVSYF